MKVKPGQIIKFYNNHLPELFWLVIDVVDEIEDEDCKYDYVYAYRINYDAEMNWITYQDYQFKETEKMVIAENVPDRVIDFCNEVITQKRAFWNNFKLQ